MANNTPTSQPWDPNSTVTINELVTNRIKAQQQTYIKTMRTLNQTINK